MLQTSVSNTDWACCDTPTGAPETRIMRDSPGRGLPHQQILYCHVAESCLKVLNQEVPLRKDAGPAPRDRQRSQLLRKAVLHSHPTSHTRSPAPWDPVALDLVEALMCPPPKSPFAWNRPIPRNWPESQKSDLTWSEFMLLSMSVQLRRQLALRNSRCSRSLKPMVSNSDPAVQPVELRNPRADPRRCSSQQLCLSRLSDRGKDGN